mgnify:CR=1 FL=1
MFKSFNITIVFALLFFIFANYTNQYVAFKRDKYLKDIGYCQEPLLDVVLDNIPEPPPDKVELLEYIEEILVVIPPIAYICVGAPNSVNVLFYLGIIFLLRAATMAVTVIPTCSYKRRPEHPKNLYVPETGISFSGHTVSSLGFLLAIYFYGHPKLALCIAPFYVLQEVIKLYVRNHYTMDILIAIGLVSAPYMFGNF